MDSDLHRAVTRRHTGAFGGQPVLDAATIEELLVLGGRPLVHELIDLFLADCEGRVRTLVGGLDAGDLRSVARAAHALRSGSASLGALSLAAALGQLEDEARGGDEDRTARLVVAVCGMLPQVRVALADLRDG